MPPERLKSPRNASTGMVSPRTARAVRDGRVTRFSQANDHIIASPAGRSSIPFQISRYTCRIEGTEQACGSRDSGIRGILAGNEIGRTTWSARAGPGQERARSAERPWVKGRSGDGQKDLGVRDGFLCTHARVGGGDGSGRGVLLRDDFRLGVEPETPPIYSHLGDVRPGRRRWARPEELFAPGPHHQLVAPVAGDPRLAALARAGRQSRPVPDARRRPLLPRERHDVGAVCHRQRGLRPVAVGPPGHRQRRPAISGNQHAGRTCSSATASTPSRPSTRSSAASTTR